MVVLQASQTIDTAENYLLDLCLVIFKARDFGKIEKQIADASKIRFGLKALNLLTPDEEAYQRIIVGLNKLCNVSTSQNVPLITI